MKTIAQIYTDIYRVILSSPIASLSGEVYKEKMPTGSRLEDCVIRFNPASNGQFVQDGQLSIMIYFNDIYENNSYYLDTIRAGVLENLLFNLSNSLYTMNEYVFLLDSRRISIEDVEEIHRHYVILKINLKLLQ